MLFPKLTPLLKSTLTSYALGRHLSHPFCLTIEPTRDKFPQVPLFTFSLIPGFTQSLPSCKRKRWSSPSNVIIPTFTSAWSQSLPPYQGTTPHSLSVLPSYWGLPLTTQIHTIRVPHLTKSRWTYKHTRILPVPASLANFLSFLRIPKCDPLTYPHNLTPTLPNLSTQQLPTHPPPRLLPQRPSN